MKTKYKLVLFLIIGVLLGYAIGYTVGYTSALNWAVEQGINLLHIKGYDIEIDRPTVIMGLTYYKSQFERFINSSNLSGGF